MRKPLILAALLCQVSFGATLAQNQAAYVAQHNGCFFHWNMATFDPNPAFPGSTFYNLAPSTFAPSVNVATLTANINTWATMCAASGGKYAILTTKHADGFALWPTAFAVSGFSPYSIAQTSWYAANGNPDIVLIFVTACRNAGLNPVLYFSMADGTMETRDTNCVPDAASQTATCFMHIASMASAEITELLSNYGSIALLWVDSWGQTFSNPYVNIPYATLYSLVKSLQPNCLLLQNAHEGNLSHTDIVGYEIPNGGAIPTGNTLPSEGADVITYVGGALEFGTYQPPWFYAPGSSYANLAMVSAPSYFYGTAKTYWAANATYVLDFTPDQSGVIPATEALAWSHWRDDAGYGSNIAPGSTVTASSQYPGTGAASALVDGVLLNPASTLTTFVHTNSTDTTPSQSIDLGAARAVALVNLINRDDGSAGRLRDLTIMLYDASHTQIGQITGINAGNLGYGYYVGDGSYANGPNELSVAVSPALKARYMKISRTPDAGAGNSDDKNDLVMIEVQILTAKPTGILIGQIGK